MMSRFLLTLFVSFLFIHTQQAQVLSGAAAQKKLAGAELLRFSNGQSLPAYIRLNHEASVAESEGLDFLKKHLQLAENIDFELLQTTTDELGFTHYRYQQTVKGFPVFAGIYLLHCREGRVVSFNGALFDQPTTLDAQPQLSADEAISLAMHYLPAETYAWEITSPLSGKPMTEYPNPELVWVPRHLDYKAPEFRLAYRLDIYALQPLQRSWVFVDAKTGIVIATENRICQVDEEGTALTSLSGERSIVADRISTTRYRLRESGRGNGIATLNMQQSMTYEDAVDFEDEDNYWHNANEFRDEIATDAHWATESYFDYLLERHNRESIDGAGAQLVSYLHFDVNFGNAFWDGIASTFGDGNPDGSLNLPVVALEIVAHEFTHGLTDYSADLIYLNESGALNESFSDIFGAATDIYTRPGQINWLIGEESTIGAVGIRNFADPNTHEDPDTYLGDFYQVGGGDGGGVHTNSGVMNYWFYLLSEGGSGINDNGDVFDITAIGWEKAMQIAYRNLTVYLTPSSSYEDAAFYANTAAIDLFGACSEEFTQNNNAWYAVGLGTPQQQVTEASFSAQQLHCSLPAEVQFFNTSYWAVNAFWDFGDGQTTSTYNPIHEYNQPGAYTVSLIVTGCDGTLDTLTSSSYIVVDTAQTYCNPIQMQFIGEATIGNCSGVVTDPGGFSDYMNGSYTILTIAPPNSSSLQLDFIEFETEACCDRLNVYDGPNINALRIASFEGTEGLGQTLTANSGSVTLEFLSNGSVTFPGYVISFNTTGGLDVPDAAFTVNNLHPPLQFPVQFTDVSDPGGRIEWNFGDSQTSEMQNPVHQYSIPGTYTVQQTISNCYGQDTSFQEVVVQESGTISWSPDSICVTLFSGEDLDTSALVQNAGPGDLYYHLEAPQATFSDHSVMDYFNAGATTQHFFENISTTLQELTITVVLSGDYDDVLEYAALYVDGELIEEIEDGNVSNGTPIIQAYTFDESTIAPWIADGMLEIALVNSAMVDVGFGGEDRHQMKIEGKGPGWLTLDQEEGILSPGQLVSIPVHISAEGLVEGIYQTAIPLIHGDIQQQDITFPVKLTVIGTPEITVSPDTIDFGSIFLGYSAVDSMTLSNPGTGTLTVSNISSGDPIFALDTMNLMVPPLDSTRVQLTFTPSSTGNFITEILYESDAGNARVVAVGKCVAPPVIAVQPDSICVTLLSGTTTTEIVTISNAGLGDLRYETLVDAGLVEILALLHGVDTDEEFPTMINGLNQYFTNYNLTATLTDDPTELEAILQGKEVLLLPESESGSGLVFSQLAPVIQNFVNAGGGVIYCFVGTGTPVVHGGIFNIEAHTELTGNTLEIQNLEHPLVAGVVPPLVASNATEGIQLNDPNTEMIVSAAFANWASLAAKSYGQGKAVYIGSDYYEPDPNANQILANAVKWTAGRSLPEWLQITPLTGNIAPNGAQVLTIDFDATGLLAGTYEYKLIIGSNDPENPEILIPVKMIVEALPQAAFAADPVFSCNGIVHFSDETVNEPNTWFWDFGDGETSTEEHPTHAYSMNGAYDISLIACNDLGCDTLVRENYVQVDLAASFCDTLTLGTTGTTFHSSCTGLLYDNGGPTGDYANGVEVAAVIAPPGATEITLHFDEFQLENCCDYLWIYDGPDASSPLIGSYNGTSLAGQTITSTGGVVTLRFSTNASTVYPGFAMRWECSGQSPEAAFSVSETGDCGNERAFNNQSSGGNSFLWDFGDGSTSEAFAPQHAFGGTGDYTVTLTTVNDFGADTFSQTVTIDEVPFNLTVNAPDTVLSNMVVNFNYTASEAVDLQWDFGPYGIIQSPTPSLTFLIPGEYDIFLLATAADGCQMLVHHRLTVLINTAATAVNKPIAVNLFPNPTSGLLHLEIQSDQSQKIRLEWYNILGQQLHAKQLSPRAMIQETLDISHFPKGIYWLVLKDNTGWQTHRQVTVQ